MKSKRISDLQSNFGLIAWLEATRIALPLKGVECRFDVTGPVASVELDQIYHQSASRPLDCIYTFPLPAGAAVYRCELHINGRVIRAKVEEKEAARKIYREQKAAGRRTALVETERENIFTLTVGNVQPEDVIVVRFAWFQVLDRSGEGLRLMIPTCPGVRYIPGKPLLRALSGSGTVGDTDQVPDASRITPPRIDALHPDAAYFSLEGRLSAADVENGMASSPSHLVVVEHKDDVVTVKLASRAEVPDKDFVLAWREPKANQLMPQVWRRTEGKETYVLVQLRAPQQVKVAESYAQDFYFLVDRSGSMSGAKWQRTCEALRAFVGLLGAEDRVWITLFESDYRDFAEAPVSAPAVLVDRGFQRMEALGTDGGTQLLPAALHVIKQISIHSAGRRANVVLITDGEVGNDAAIVSAFKQTPKVTVHTFGIDTTVNDAFLKSLARQQRGGCWLQTPNDDIAGTIAALGDRLRRPVLTDLSVRGSWEAGRETWPDLHAKEVVTVSLRGDAATAIEIIGRLPDGSEHCFVVGIGTAGSEAVKLLWTKERIAALLESGRKPEAIALAKQHNLICEGAAFIAWDEAEQVQIANQEIVQPALEPSDMTVSALFAKPSPSLPAMHYCASPVDEDTILSDVDLAPRKIAEPCIQDVLRHLLPLVVHLREAFKQAGVPEPTSEAFVVWAQREDREVMRRLRALHEAAILIAQIRNQLDGPVLRDLLDAQIQKVLRGSPEALIKWVNESGVVIKQVMELRRKLVAAGKPEESVDRLIVWFLEPGTFNRDRLKILMTFTDSLNHLPFSECSVARHWRVFLDSTIGPGYS